MKNLKKIQAPADFWGEAMLLAATLKALVSVGKINPDSPIIQYMEILQKCEDLAKRLETRIDIQVMPKDVA